MKKDIEKKKKLRENFNISMIYLNKKDSYYNSIIIIRCRVCISNIEDIMYAFLLLKTKKKNNEKNIDGKSQFF